MNNIFSPDEVTIVRKKGDSILTQTINTFPLLSGGVTDPASVRRNVIARLRKDPSVIFVLEGQDGVCEETAELQDGFSITVSLYEDASKASCLNVLHNGKAIYSVALQQNEYEEFVDSEGCSLTSNIEELLHCIEDKDYSLFEELDPELAEDEEEEEDVEGDDFCLFDAVRVLDENGYETETIAIDEFNEPVMFVYENDVLLLGAVHFQGHSMYLDMKRVPMDLEPDLAQDILRKFRQEVKGIQVIEWEDGSWSFRHELGWIYNKEQFLERLAEGIAALSAVSDWLLGQEGLFCDFNGEREKRYLFIHEVIAEHIKLKNLKY